MSERPFMQIAVDEAAKSRDETDEPIHPKVGAVVIYDGKELARAHRGEFHPVEHAEFTILERKLGTQSIAGATVFTTLEPCTERGFGKRPCAEWLIQRQVKRVVIGTLDPNQEIRGKGEWSLQEAGIQIGKFDPDLVRVLLEMNRHFIEYQMGMGVQVKRLSKDAHRGNNWYIVRGTYHRHPFPNEHVYGFVRAGNRYWPQSPLTYDQSNMTWECRVNFGQIGDYIVYVARVSEDIVSLINLYYAVGQKHNDWIPQQWSRLPKGIHILGEIPAPPEHSR